MTKSELLKLLEPLDMNTVVKFQDSKQVMVVHNIRCVKTSSFYNFETKTATDVAVFV